MFASSYLLHSMAIGVVLECVTCKDIKCRYCKNIDDTKVVEFGSGSLGKQKYKYKVYNRTFIYEHKNNKIDIEKYYLYHNKLSIIDNNKNNNINKYNIKNGIA